jgi:hypothetical protein
MSDETYYTVLNVKETASSSEIKTAYRDLIKQVHPDTIATLAPYLRRIAEDKAKEITEAYTVLSNTGKRRDYDRQLAEYRRQTTPQTPPHPPAPAPQQAASQTSSGPYCNRCGTSLYASGFCPKCNKFTTPVATRPQRKALYWLGYNWAPLMRWSREHPVLALAIPVFSVWLLVTLVSSNDGSSQSDSTCPPSQRVEVNGRFVCQQAPVQPSKVAASSNAPSPATAGFTIVSGDSPPSKPIVSVSGTYFGTVHNKTANISSTFTTVLHQSKGGALEGCMEVKPPLYGSGAVHGSVRGSHLDFVIADITFKGDVSKNAVSGSYVVSRQDSQQFGDFRMTKQPGMQQSYGCADGSLVEVEMAKPRPKPEAEYADVGRYYTSIYKRCAFLPNDNFGRCNYQPETIAELKTGDRVRVLSRMVRAENGDDIYKVRTEQGWEGWIDARGITLESP